MKNDAHKNEAKARVEGLAAVMPGLITGLVLLALGALAFPILQPGTFGEDVDRLNGRMYATGFIVDGSGGVRASFRATLNGALQDGGLAIIEQVQVIGGRSESNRWRLNYGEPFRAGEELRLEFSRREGDLVRGVWSLLPAARRDGDAFLAERRISDAAIGGLTLEVKFTRTPPAVEVRFSRAAPSAPV